MEIALIQVPYMMGDERCGSSKGPARLVKVGADHLLRAKGLAVSLEAIDSELIPSFDLPPDGKELVMNRGTASRDVVLIRDLR